METDRPNVEEDEAAPVTCEEVSEGEGKVAESEDEGVFVVGVVEGRGEGMVGDRKCWPLEGVVELRAS